MKMESGGGGVATSNSSTNSAALHKIKVKEEAKDCSVPRQTKSPTPPRPAGIGAIGAIATITIGSANCGSEFAAAAAVASATKKSINGEEFPVDLDIKSRGEFLCEFCA